MGAGFHLKKSNPMKINVERERELACALTQCNSIMCVCSHLEVSVYYTLLMAILHRWHNLEGERKGEMEQERKRQSERKDDKMDGFKWLDNKVKDTESTSSWLLADEILMKYTWSVIKNMFFFASFKQLTHCFCSIAPNKLSIYW